MSILYMYLYCKYSSLFLKLNLKSARNAMQYCCPINDPSLNISTTYKKINKNQKLRLL